jgi:menaquinone-dependent protoporphyrinogen oxidase
MRVLICYATTDGQTQKVAECIAEAVRKNGHQADIFDANMAERVDPLQFQAAILAGSVHMGRYQPALVHRIRRWRDALSVIPTAFVSVSLSAASKDPHIHAEIDECAQHMLKEAGFQPAETIHVAGAMRFSQYDFFRRWMMRLAAKQMDRDLDPTEDQEFTDWGALTTSVDRFLASVRA